MEQRLRWPMDPVSAAHHFMLRRARDDTTGLFGFTKALIYVLWQLASSATTLIFLRAGEERG
jgi:hypothetical protein